MDIFNFPLVFRNRQRNTWSQAVIHTLDSARRCPSPRGENVAIPPFCNENSGKPGLGGGSCLRRHQARQPLSVSRCHRHLGPLMFHCTALYGSWRGCLRAVEVAGGRTDERLGVCQVSCHVNGKKKRLNVKLIGL